MKRPTPPHDKYFLRDLHKEIDLYDRKLAYLDTFVEFLTPADREEAQDKLRSKRAPLEKTARQLAASGVEFAPEDLPRSFRPESIEPAEPRRKAPRKSAAA
jgi:hypothetical protein